MSNASTDVTTNIILNKRLAARAEAARLQAEQAVKLAYVSVGCSVISLFLAAAAVAR